jgi:serine/threonine protein kinase
MVRALAALHRAGFVHRLVSPHSFSYLTPPTSDSLINRLLITDLSLCMPWPRRPRAKVPFVGTMRYSGVKVHDGREQGPSTDIQSIIFIVAEMISGRLPWRSVLNLRLLRELKIIFGASQEFRRLPKEIRVLYKYAFYCHYYNELI